MAIDPVWDATVGSNRSAVICIALILAAIGVTWWFYGFGPLVVVLALSAAVCPAIVIWVTRKQRALQPPDDTPRAGQTARNRKA